MKRIRVSAVVLAAACSLAASGADAFPGGGPGGSTGQGRSGGHRPPSFEELDVDGNGAVTEDEFLAPMLQHGEERFSRMDADGDGSLTSDELRPPSGGRGAGRAVQR